YNFLNHPDLSAADFLAWIDDPGRFTGEKGAWLGAPHRVLFATFLRLAAELRDLQNQFGARHLDFHVRKVLGMAPQPAVADRVAVLFGLSAKVAAMDLPAGTALRAGRDASGVERIYQTEQDLHVTRASVAELRALSVDRRVIGIPDVRRDAAYTAAGAFDQALKVALGSPLPGDAIPAWQGQAITCAFFVNLIPQLDFCEQKLYLPHHELRSLLQRVRRRQDANAEWAELNRRMGLGSSTSRDFDANFRTQFGTIDYKTDGLAQVDSLDDLYLYREERDVRDYITIRFSKIGYDNFVRMMEIKRAIDSEWSAINATLQRMGQRQRQQPGWVFRPAIPSAFDTNLAAALGSAWPPPWPSPTTSIDSYDRRLRDLEAALSMSVERARRLADFAAELGQNADANAFDWSDADALLQEAYTERNRALRRARIAAVRNGVTTQSDLERCATFVLKEQRIEPVLPWSSARIELGTALDSASLALLDAYLEQTQTPGAMARLAWADVDRVLELAWRNHASLEEPAAAYTTWHNAYSYADVTEQRPDPDSSRWRLFGGVPTGTASAAPAANFGFALRSGMLSLSSGRRKLTFTLGFSSQGFSGNRIRAALGLPDNIGGESLSNGLARVLQIEVSTEKGWVELPLVSAGLTDGQGSDYFSLTGRTLDLVADHDCTP
ncbi:MAG TPA: hypothetical protein PLA94_21900, partial [Myxococcota bacterium]|nr:hypothetical protein [Myxococcota bacterium]